MGTGLHRDLPYGEIHVVHAFEYANAAAREGAVGLVPADIGRVARQLDNGTFWILVDDSPVTWRQFVTNPLPSGMKSGILIPGDFSGNPKQATVTFASAYPDTNYTITVSVETINNKSFALRYESKATTGFDVDLGSNNIANLVSVSWQTVPVGE
jgi:hypothetical protein